MWREKMTSEKDDRGVLNNRPAFLIKDGEYHAESEWIFAVGHLLPD
jgi:hypothetical protein